jgi:hypothetical protein
MMFCSQRCSQSTNKVTLLAARHSITGSATKLSPGASLMYLQKWQYLVLKILNLYGLITRRAEQRL